MEQIIEEQPMQKITRDDENLCGGEEVVSISFADGSSYGKFKSADDLLNAYNNLQAEFTRRSQRLRSLEKELEEQHNNLSNFNEVNNNEITQNENGKTSNSQTSENLKNNTSESEVLNNENAELEKLSTANAEYENHSEVAQEKIYELYDTADNESVPSYLKSDYSENLAKFLSENKDAKLYAKEIGEEILKDKTLSLQSAYDRVLAKMYKAPSELANDDEFINNYILSNENLLKNLLKKYKMEEKTIPTMISNAKGSIAQAYPVEVKTIKEAGEVAYKLFS